MKGVALLILLYYYSLVALGQTGTVKGRVFNEVNNENIPFATVGIQNTSIGTTTDVNGEFELKNIPPGLYNLEVTFLGYKTKVLYEIQVNAARITFLDFPMQEETENLDAVVIEAAYFEKSAESPLSLRKIGTSEIERNPGGNRDISKALQSLPGVSSTVSFRNDIIIRGGAPNENRFFLDGIEVPNINHFATQGSSGGPVGMINVNFIREVEFYSSAFPANRGNSLSSVLEFEQKEGNKDKLESTFILGSSDIGLTLDGPIGNKTTYLFSVRRSYLQFLFAALKLPFLPTYNDFQFKTKTNLTDKDQLTVIGLGAIDQFELNESVNNGVTDADLLERNQFVLDNVPDNEQWNYTIGMNYKHFRDKGYMTVVTSRNHLNNSALKYSRNVIDPQNLILDYNSEEIENKLRIENDHRIKRWSINYGIGYEHVTYRNSTINKVTTPAGLLNINYESNFSFNKYALFSQVSNRFFKNILTASFGLRTDLNDYSSGMNNPLDQLSPRAAISIAFAPRWAFNASVGTYFQLPPYTILGFKDSTNTLVNKENGIKYIQTNHHVAGFEYRTEGNSIFTLEAFYKHYDNYPLLITDSVSLANLGGDFGVIGNEPSVPNSDGRAYGLEFLFQQKLQKGIYGILAYTLVRSEFTNGTNKYAPSAWDNRHIINLTAGKKLKKNWEIGFKWRFSGGNPYTPYNIANSALKVNWVVNGRGVRDYSQINTERTSVTHQLDVRIDKRYYFAKWTLDIYFDVQNLYNYQTNLGPLLLLERDENGDPIEDPNNPNSYQTKTIDDLSGNVLPSIGLIIEF